MMNRKPAVDTVASMLTSAFADANVKLGHQKSLNLAAQTQGYKNYAHYKAEADRKGTLAAVSAPAPVQAAEPEPTAEQREIEKLHIALEWLVLRTEAVLARRPVRDMDECLSHAKLLLAARGNND
jgi:hypothetical protein